METEEILKNLRKICEPNIIKNMNVPIGQAPVWEIQLPGVFLGYSKEGRRNSAILCAEGSSIDQVARDLWSIVELTESEKVSLVKIEKRGDEEEKLTWWDWDSGSENWVEADNFYF
ncbi:MAG: hypothetical protein V3574_00515 [Candidatus Moraniibacteriota bacterium]